MLRSFSNLSIYKKIFFGFSIVIFFSVAMAFVGVLELGRIRDISQSLTPLITERAYLENSTVALGALDNDIERYVTVSSVTNKESISANISVIEGNTQLLYAADSGQSDELGIAKGNLGKLKADIAALISLEEGLQVKGINEQVVLIYGELRDLRDLYRKIAESIQGAFTASLKEQEKRIGLIINEFLIIEILILIFGIVITFLLSRTITAPITELRNTTNLLAKGNYNVRAKVLGNDEVGELSLSFNTMAEKLLLYTTRLEAEVSERTLELKEKVVELNASNNLLVKREEELTLVNERLQELDKAKSEFISVAAHQLRTPLSAIKWTLSLLDEESGNFTPEQRSLLLKGYESNERIITLVNEMLVVTRIEAGKIQYTFTHIHLEDLVDSVLIDFAGPTHMRNIKLVFNKPPAPLPYVNVDPDKIRDTVQNLVENAMRYTPDGGEIVVSVTNENDSIKVSIKDSGIGIPEHQQSSIFNKFFRADNAVRARTDGSGLGLFIAKSIVDSHKGQIGFESTEGKGSTFYFTIPCAPTSA